LHCIRTNESGNASELFPLLALPLAFVLPLHPSLLFSGLGLLGVVFVGASKVSPRAEGHPEVVELHHLVVGRVRVAQRRHRVNLGPLAVALDDRAVDSEKLLVGLHLDELGGDGVVEGLRRVELAPLARVAECIVGCSIGRSQ
jgi:hypothetical protein